MLAFLCVPDARAETPPAQAQDEILQNIDFQPVPMQEDLMAFDRIPTGIALSESGFAAASYDRNTRRFLLLFCPDGEVKQYTFCTSGSYALYRNEELLLQTTASALLVHRLGYCWPFVVMAIGMLLFYRQTKQRSRQQSEATP